MDEKKRNLRVLEKAETETQKPAKDSVEPKFSHPNQTNPILKKLAWFTNSKIGNKLSIKDLLR